jgi:hypothetical protein
MIRRRWLLSFASIPALVFGAIAIATGPPASAASPNLFANVDVNGALVSGSGVSSVTHTTGTGQYEVTFATDVSGCAYVATTVNAFSQALQVFTAGGHLSADGVYVETKNQGGGLTDGPFELVVDCGNPGMQYAVVGYSANLVRATAGTTLTNLGAGRYDVTFPSNVQHCAYLATVGDPANALVFNPSGVYTGTGPGVSTVYIETKNPGGGLTAGIPFHLAVVCNTAASVHVAVVSSTGIIQRGSPLTSAFRASTGNFVVVANKTIPNCATVATRGSVNTGVPFSPATVEITPGPASNTVGIQVRTLLHFGGNLANQAFHAATVC